MAATASTAGAVPSGPAAGTATTGTATARGPDAEIDRFGELAGLPAAVRARAQWLAADLVEYQDAVLARRFVALVAEAWGAEERAGGDGRLAAAVAFGYHKLLAYKDEYEVARLLLERPATEGRTTWLLHPPALRAKGLQRKLRLGPWARPALRTLRATRRLRGTPLDPFGRTPLRRTERQLPDEYADAIRTVLGRLGPESLDAAVEIARLPDRVRGFESVKERNVGEYRRSLAELLAAFPSG